MLLQVLVDARIHHRDQEERDDVLDEQGEEGVDVALVLSLYLARVGVPWKKEVDVVWAYPLGNNSSRTSTKVKHG